MKVFKKLIVFLLLLVVLLVALAYLFKVDYLLKAVRTIYLKGHTTAYLDDYHVFDNREISPSEQPLPWAFHTDYNKKPLSDAVSNTHRETGTVAYLIIKNDSIWHESYYDGFANDSKSNSFSMAKSMVSAALGKAIMQGRITSLDQKVIHFLPNLQGPYANDVTVGDLASMASGLQWDESYYSPFSVTTRAYFDDNLKALMMSLPIVEAPGREYKYLSGSTQLLGIVLEKATEEKLTDYLATHFWKPMGAENGALWQLDRPDGMEKAYCCVASNARDFARFGRLYKQKGHWNGIQILDSSFVKKSVTPRFESSPEYGYGWWLSNHLDKSIFYMRGHLGQYVIVIPEDDVIIVRLGHKNGAKIDGDAHSEDFYLYIDETLKMLSND